MASIPASPTPSHHSPSSASSCAPIELTPRSKVKQLLASLDDSDDYTTTVCTKAVTKTVNKPNSPSFNRNVDTLPAKHQTSGSDDDSDVPRARQGTKAARMQADNSLQDYRSDNSSAGVAYRRVRRRLLAKPAVEAQQKEPQTSTTPQEQLTNPEQRPSASPTSTTKPRRRSASPDLFVSPRKEGGSFVRTSLSDGEGPRPIQPTNIADKLQALAERRRKEERLKKANISSDEESDPMPTKLSPTKSRKQPRVRAESEGDDDADATKALTQQAKPTRKASKKAIEEMHRETQRMSRNMQLTHEARTKTKFSTADLFAKFNFRRAKSALPQTRPQEQQHASSSSNQSPDGEGPMGHETPSSSPPSVAGNPFVKTLKSGLETNHDPMQEADDHSRDPEDDLNDLPDLQTLLTQKAREANASSTIVAAPVTIDNNGPVNPAPTRASARRFAKSAVKPRAPPESDDDLEIVKPRKASRLPIFDRIPESKAKESHSLHALRALAHLNESEKCRRKGKKSLTPMELQSVLHKRARVQALQERDEKIQRLRDRGVIIQTADEKEKEQLQLESMLERARKEADDLAKKEKKAAKREGKEAGGNLLDDDDDDDDEDYEASDEDDVAQLSGSEDEGENEEDEVADGSDYGKDDVGEPRSNDHIDSEVSDDGEEDPSDDEMDGDTDQAEDEIDTMLPPRLRLSRRKIVDSDDEDEESQPKARQGIEPMPEIPVTPAPIRVPKTPKPSTSDAFGFSNRKPIAPIGLSQVFAGTMAEDQTQGFNLHHTTANLEQDSMDFLRRLPVPELPGYDDSLVADSPRTVVEDSQMKETPTHKIGSQPINLVNFDNQTQRLGGETQISELLEPTQDDGFQIKDSQPLQENAYSTAETVPIERVSPSPEKQSKKNKGRLVKRSARATMVKSGDEVQVNYAEEEEEPTLLDAFEHMRQKRAEVPKPQEAFGKNQSKAKTMVEEQAEESEDEYAGLGGASDDEDQDEVDEETKKMIDDNGNELTDERDIAAYYADKERREDEKGIEKLYKDVINGGLRRKRGAEHDLWDSDDEDEAAAHHRAAKQREFAKMRKALLADEKIGKIAENPKQAAFMQALEDRDEMEDLDFFDGPQESFTVALPDSQAEASGPQPLAAISGNNAGTKRTHAEYTDLGQASQDAENMPPPANPRRTKAAKTSRPTSLADIRTTLSEIIGEPESVLESQRLRSQSPEHSVHEYDQNDNSPPTEDENEELYRHPSEPVPSSHLERNPRRTNPNIKRDSVINRIALRKQVSSLGRSIDSNQSRLAFQPSTNTSFSFKVPSLLRRATTNSSTGSMDTSAGLSAAAGGLGGKDAVKRGGSAKSSVNYYVRELERKAKLEKIEKERMEGRLRVGRMRREVLAGKGARKEGGLGGLVGGGFD